MTFCVKTAGSGVRFRTHGTQMTENGWTDRHGSQNSYLDILAVAASICSSALPCPARH